MPSNSQDGRQSNLFGPEVVLANPSASPAKGQEQTTPDTSGLRCAASLASVALQLSLASRLQAALDVNGSPEYALTWKRWDMQSGPPICALRARAHRISASVSTGERKGWATPLAQQANGTPAAFLKRKRDSMARGRSSMGVCLSDLNMQVQAWVTLQVAGWPTPRAGDGEKNVRTLEGSLKEIARKNGPQDTVQAAQMAGWPTPMVPNGGRVIMQEQLMTGKRANGTKVQIGLENAVTLAGRPTPTTRDHKDGSYCPNVETNALLGRVVWTAGPLPGGLNALTEKPVAYRLNPNFSRWLMGFPAEWANSVPTAMPSSRKSRRSS